VLRNILRLFDSSFSRDAGRTRDPIAEEITGILDALERELAALRSEYYAASTSDPIHAHRAA